MSAASVADRPRLRLLQEHDFRLLWIGETTSCLGSSVSSVALPLVALVTLHASVFAVSLLSAAAWLPWVLIGLPAGAWVDRLRRRPVMIVADLVSLLAFASVPIAAAFGDLTMTMLLVATLLAGAAAVFFETAYRAIVPSIVPTEHLLEANAKLQGSEQVTDLAGPGLAGLIAQAARPVGGVIVDAVSFAVSALCLMRVRVEEVRPQRESRRLRTEIAEGLRTVWREPLLRTNAISGSLANLVLTGYQSILIAFLVRDVGISAGLTGVLLAVSSLGGVAGAMGARRLAGRFGTARAVLIGKVALTPFGLLIPLVHHNWTLGLFVLGSFVVVAGIVAGNIIWQGWVQTYVPAETLGRVSTSVQVINFGAIPLGAVIAGAAAGSIGIRPTLWIMLSGLIVASAIRLIGPGRRLRDLPARASVPAESPLPVIDCAAAADSDPAPSASARR